MELENLELINLMWNWSNGIEWNWKWQNRIDPMSDWLHAVLYLLTLYNSVPSSILRGVSHFSWQSVKHYSEKSISSNQIYSSGWLTTTESTNDLTTDSISELTTEATDECTAVTSELSTVITRESDIDSTNEHKKDQQRIGWITSHYFQFRTHPTNTGRSQIRTQNQDVCSTLHYMNNLLCH